MLRQSLFAAALAGAAAASTFSLPANAAPNPGTQAQEHNAAIVQADYRCGRGWHLVPGHPGRWHWVKAHCTPNYYR